MKTLWFLLLLLLLPQVAAAQLSTAVQQSIEKQYDSAGRGIYFLPYVVARLPIPDKQPQFGPLVVGVTDGADSSDCTVGLGTDRHLCMWNGSAWVAVGAGGGGGGTPGGAANSIQYNNAGAFGGFGSWNGTTFAIPGSANSIGLAGSSTGNAVTITATGSDADVPIQIVSKGIGGTLVPVTHSPSTDGTFVTALTGSITVQGSHDIGQANAAFNFVDNQNTGTTSELFGTASELYNNGGGAVTQMASYYAYMDSEGPVTDAYGYYVNRIQGSGTFQNWYSFYSKEQGANATINNSYYFWADSRGVFRIRQDSTFDGVAQAIAALYNPQFAKYTAGATNFERIILGQWNGNVAEFGTEKGGTGTLRTLRLIGSGYQLAALTGNGFVKTSGGNGALSVDTATYLTTAVTSATGTSNQISVSAATGAVTFSTPQDIATSSTPQFARLGIGAAAHASIALTSTAASLGFGLNLTGNSTGRRAYTFEGDSSTALLFRRYTDSFAAPASTIWKVNNSITTDTFVITAGSFDLSALATTLSWGGGQTVMLSDAANIVAQRNAANAQTFRVYGTFTDTSNYERASLSHVTGTGVLLAAQTAGTGGDDLSVTITPAGTGNIILSAIPRLNGTNSTGAGAALLGSNSPASTLTAPYTWVTVVTSDGSTGYMPIWK